MQATGPTLLDTLLARHCAPALLRQKSANLFFLPAASWQTAQKELAGFNNKVAPRGLAAEELCRCEKRVLLLVYHKERLAKELANPMARELLAEHSYPFGPLQAQLAHLKGRLAASAEFPHEIGLFLGYPPGDVKCFICHKGKGALLSGPWQVYENPEHSKRLFARYRACTQYMCGRISRGQTVLQALHIP